MKHKYLHELFPNPLPFPYNKRNYHGFDERDTFNLDSTLIMWLYERLRYFQDEASKTVDFNFHKFDIDGKELTQLECINRMVEDCKIILLYDGGSAFDDYEEEAKYFENVVDVAKDDLFKVLSKVYWAMWW